MIMRMAGLYIHLCRPFKVHRSCGLGTAAFTHMRFWHIDTESILSRVTALPSPGLIFFSSFQGNAL